MTRGRTALVAMVGALALAAPAAADPVPDGYEWTEHYFPSADGTRLHADVLRPRDLRPGERTPVALLISPYLSETQRDDATIPDPTTRGPRSPNYHRRLRAELVRRRYTIVQASPRGFGASAGCNDYFGAGEQADAKAAVEWAASLPQTNGRVGTFGISYEGALQVAALATRPRGLAAAAIEAPVISGYRGDYMNRNRYAPFGYELAFFNQYVAAHSPSALSNPEQWVNTAPASATQVECGLRHLPEADWDPDTPYWRERDLAPRAATSSVPVLWTHGFRDANTKPDNILDVYGRLRGPKRAWFGQFHHCPPGESVDGVHGCTRRDGLAAEIADWFDAHVRRDAAALRRVRRQPAVEVEDSSGRWRPESAWPPRDAGFIWLPVRPGSYLDQGFSQADVKRTDCPEGTGSDAYCAPQEQTGVGTWTMTLPFRYPGRLAGTPRLTADVRTPAANVNLIALLYDVAPEGRARLITRGAYVVGQSGRVVLDLYPQDWLFAAGHRIGLLLAGGDDWWFTPGVTGARVEVAGGRLRLPFLRCRRDASLTGGPSYANDWSGPIPVDRATVDAAVIRFPLAGRMIRCPRRNAAR